MNSVMRGSTGIAVACGAMLSGCSTEKVQHEVTVMANTNGCTPWAAATNPPSLHSGGYVYTISGGNCGGQVDLLVKFLGEAEHENDTLNKAAVGVIPDSTTFVGALSTPLNSCKEGLNSWSDYNFNKFDVWCHKVYDIQPGVVRSFVLTYDTNHVRGGPGQNTPLLYTAAKYFPK